ncbi:MAG TPA: peptidylprolyl isomerase [Caulobacteraceae bacterium]|jgi:peptidyl-prolyl cis-trans isomerase A (cyclophilin A)
MIRPIDRRGLLAAGLVLAAGPALAQSQTPAPASAPPAPLAPPEAGIVRVALRTGKGLIVLDLNQGKAPITAGNFLRYVDLRRFDGASFYRASRIQGAPETGVVQGGLRNDPAKVLKPIAHESTLKTGLSHKDGAISMGRRAPGTATSDFFICVGDQTYFDADPAAKGDNLGFAAFGYVVQGMDVVRTILALPTSATGGVGVMRGEMLKPPVPILTARREIQKRA